MTKRTLTFRELISDVDRDTLMEEGEGLVRFVEENATSFEVQVKVYD